MVVDASAVLAILFNEPEAEAFRRLLLSGSGAKISAVNYWEIMISAQREAGHEGRQRAEWLLRELGVEIAATTPEQARLAVDAHERFGRATPAKLNLGDCFAYALATAEGDGLLFKGDDFPRTDVKSALA